MRLRLLAVGLLGMAAVGGCDRPPPPDVRLPDVSPAPVALTRGPAVPSGTVARLEARFGDRASIRGEARYKAKLEDDLLMRKLEVEMFDAPPGEVYRVSVDGRFAGELIAGADGHAIFELDEDETDHAIFLARFTEPRPGSRLQVGAAFESRFHAVERLVDLEVVFEEPGGATIDVDFKKTRLGDEECREFEVEVENAVKGETWAVALDGRPIGQVVIGRKGKGRLRLGFTGDPFPPDFEEPRVGSVVMVGASSAVIQIKDDPAWPGPGEHLAVGASSAVAGPVVRARWTDLETDGPSGRSAPTAGEDMAMAYDPKRGQVFLYGGKGDDLRNTSELWMFDLAAQAWSKVTCAGEVPPPREDHTLVVDLANDALVMFGGEDGQTSDETWCLDLTRRRWERFAIDGAPAREMHVAAYDPAGRRMVAFGGQGIDSQPCGDTWSLDLDRDSGGYGTWSRLDDGAEGPGPRREHMGTYDAAHHRLLVYGGRQWAARSFLADLWALDLSDGGWARLLTSGDAPPPLRRGALAHDPVLDELMLFGGEILVSIEGEDERFLVNRIWVLDVASGAWTDRSPYPRAMYDHAGVYVPELGGMLMYGGSSHRGNSERGTWLLETSPSTVQATGPGDDPQRPLPGE